MTTTDLRLTPEQAARLDSLFREHNAHVLRLAFAQLHDADAAQDLAQTVWLSVIPTLARGESITAPRAYLATAVRHRAINYRISAPVRRERAADWSDDVVARALPAAAPADDDALAAGELTAHQAAVLKLAAQGLSYRAIAQRLGNTHGAVYSHLHRGARKLRLSMAA